MAFCGESGQKRVADFYGLELTYLRRCKSANYPVISRVGVGSLAALSGFCKPFLIPAISAIGLLVFPIFAAYHFCRGDNEKGKDCVKAWGFCLITLGRLACFLFVTAYCLPLVGSVALVASICALSIILHVRSVMHN